MKQKWAAYKTNLAMKPWTKARGSAAYYAHWDDHEFVNDFSRSRDSFPLIASASVNIERREALQATASRRSPTTTRSPTTRRTGSTAPSAGARTSRSSSSTSARFRSTASDYQGACDNPPGSGNPDLAPTAPQSTRNVFSAIAPQLANPPPPACLDSINDPNRTMLGANQLAKFKKAIKKSSATFKVIFNEVPIQQYYALPYDRWEGYAAERTALLQLSSHDNVKNVVFLTTDVHAQPRQRRPLQHARRRRRRRTPGSST